MMAGDGPVRISDTTFLNNIHHQGRDADDHKFDLAESTEYVAIVQQGNTFYILTGPASNDEVIAFFREPARNADYMFFSTDHFAISEIIRSRNSQLNNLGDLTNQVEFRQHSVPQGILDQILPFLYIALIAVIAFFILRNFSSRGGLGNMSMHRATRIIGGPTRFSDVAGIDEELEEVNEIVQFLRNPRKFLDMGARIPKGFLLVGQPGTGKTLLAKAIAGEAGVPFMSLSGSDFSEMLVGVGPSRMRNLFEEAKANAPCIIFIDEIDSIARMRGIGVSGASDENEQTLNQLLVQMDGFTKSDGVIVLAATNRPDVLDQALLRPGRFDRQIVVQMPDVKGREKILEVHSKHKPIGTDVDLKRIAKIISGFSGADIENLMNESAIIAAKKDKVRINMADITEGINKVILGPQKRSRIITDEDKKITAYHEAGHAIVSRVLQKDQVVQEVSIIPRGMAAGYTLTNEKDTESHHKSRNFLNTQLAVFMGGRVAELLFIGDMCTGSSNDIKVATNLAERMVTAFGMSDKLGPLFYGKENEMALRMYNDKKTSESLQSVIDAEIKRFIMDAEKQSREILKKYEKHTHVMANVLLQRETIYAEDIDLIMAGKTEKQVIAEMEKREESSKKQQAKDKVDNEISVLDKDMSAMYQSAKTLLDANMIGLEQFVKLESNMKHARELVRNGIHPKLLPTLDNLDTYVTMVGELPKKTDSKKNDDTFQTKPPRPSTKTKTTKESKES